MSRPIVPPIACAPGALSSSQWTCEQALLAEFKRIFRDAQETDLGYRVVIPDDPIVLSRLGELVALERLCCPFLAFDLSIPAERGLVTLHMYGRPDTKSFLRSEFFNS